MKRNWGVRTSHREGRQRWVGGWLGGKNLFAYMYNPWAQTIGWWRPGVGAGSKQSMEEKRKEAYVILSTMKFFF